MMLSRIGKGILFIYLFFILSFVLAISIAIIRSQLHKKTDEKREKIVEAYPGEVEKYLEEKYGKPFQVEAVRYSENGGSPIPGARHYSPYEYEVYEKQGDGCPFRVWLFPESLDDKSMKEIKDNYCWKYLRDQVKEYFEQELSEMLPKEYKMVFLTDQWISYNDEIKPKSPMNHYFSGKDEMIPVKIYIITPPQHETGEGGLTEEKMNPILHDFYEENYSNMSLYFAYAQTETYQDYENIDVAKLECTKFKLYQNSKPIWSAVNMERIFTITIE